jgi:hypothetical protein
MLSNPKWEMVVQESTHQQRNKLVSHLVAKLHFLESPHYQVLELANGTTTPVNFHQSQTHQRNMVQ